MIDSWLDTAHRFCMESAPSPSTVDTADPVSPSKSLDLTTDQLTTLMGGPCEEGKTYTVVLTAGPTAEGGSQTFDVVSSTPDDESDPEDPAVDAATGEDSGPGEDHPMEGPKNLGYDIRKLRKARGSRPTPKVGMSDLL